jgi:hypothetical protein
MPRPPSAMDSWLVALITGLLTVTGTATGVLVTQHGEVLTRTIAMRAYRSQVHVPDDTEVEVIHPVS